MILHHPHRQTLVVNINTRVLNFTINLGKGFQIVPTSVPIAVGKLVFHYFERQREHRSNETQFPDFKKNCKLLFCEI
jgi:hypothetical protein